MAAIHSIYPDGTPVLRGEQPSQLPPLGAAEGGAGVIHTRLRIDTIRNRIYQGRTFDADGYPVEDVDVTVPTYPNGRPRPGHRHYERHAWVPMDPYNLRAGHRRTR